jgi:hypothetical protein
MNYGFGEANFEYFEYFESCNFSRENTNIDVQTSYSVEQADIFQYQSYSHSDDMFIILKSIINTDTSIFVFRGKNYMIQNTLPHST